MAVVALQRPLASCRKLSEAFNSLSQVAGAFLRPSTASRKLQGAFCGPFYHLVIVFKLKKNLLIACKGTTHPAKFKK